MFTGEKTGSWLRAHPTRWQFMGVGKTSDDVQEAFNDAANKGEAFKKYFGLPIGSTLPLSTSEVTMGNLKFREIMSYATSVFSIAFGMYWLNLAHSQLEANGLSGSATEMIFNLSGLAAITLVPYLSFQAGRAYRKFHSWAEANNLNSVFLGLTNTRSHP